MSLDSVSIHKHPPKNNFAKIQPPWPPWDYLLAESEVFTAKSPSDSKVNTAMQDWGLRCSHNDSSLEVFIWLLFGSLQARNLLVGIAGE